MLAPYPLGDGGVQRRGRLGAVAMLEDAAHGAAKMRPLLGHCFDDGVVAGQAMQGGMEGDVGVDEWGQLTISQSVPAFLQGCMQRSEVCRGDRSSGDPGCGQLGSQAVERGADLVKIPDAARVDGRNRDAPLPSLDEEAAAAEKLESVADGLAGDAQHIGQLFLREAAAGLEGTFDDGGQQPVVNLIDQVGLGVNLELSDRHDVGIRGARCVLGI